MAVTDTMTTRLSVGPDELLATLDDIAATLSSTHLSVSSGTQEAWAAIVTACQRIVNAACAVQDEAIVAVVAIETTQDDDGTLRQWHRVPGHVALDGPAIVSGALEVTAVHAERRVRDAVRLAADGQPGTSTCTGLGALHDAKKHGTLDSYRAGVVTFELEEAPPEVAETVIAALTDHLSSETGPQLRRRCRRLIARISPDLLRQRAKRARQECSLRRWVDQPGVDRWDGTFPSEDAAHAWAAIDARAQDLVRNGTYDRIDRARSQALVDLVTASATITTIVHLTIPADDTADSATTAGHASETNARSTASVTDATADTGPSWGADRGGADAAAGSAAGTDDTAAHAATAAGDDTTTATVVLTDGPNRVQRRSTRRHTRHDLVEIANPLGGEPMLVSQAWVDALLGDLDTRVRTTACDPTTGAMRTPAATPAYRPTAELARTIRQRDGRCRFPGCHVAARFCDLDHVRPWPTGPTTEHNLICLCRRHHRIKQRPGWTLTLHPDATITWTDPTGRTRTTHPIDALHHLVLPDPGTITATLAPDDTTDTSPTATDTSRSAAPAADGPGTSDAFSGLEFALEHLFGRTPVGRGARRHRGRTIELTPSHDLLVDQPQRACRARRPITSWDLDEPPF